MKTGNDFITVNVIMAENATARRVAEAPMPRIKHGDRNSNPRCGFECDGELVVVNQVRRRFSTLVVGFRVKHRSANIAGEKVIHFRGKLPRRKKSDQGFKILRPKEPFVRFLFLRFPHFFRISENVTFSHFSQFSCGSHSVSFECQASAWLWINIVCFALAWEQLPNQEIKILNVRQG